jgi:hypothetical protein
MTEIAIAESAIAECAQLPALIESKPPTLSEAVAQIKEALASEKIARGKAKNHRLQAALMLLALKQRIDRGEAGKRTRWWQWFKSSGLGFARSTAEKLLRIAGSDDPEAAHEAEKTKTAGRMKALRKSTAQGNVRRKTCGCGFVDSLRDAMGAGKFIALLDEAGVVEPVCAKGK